MRQTTEPNTWTQAAGAVTMSFGVLTTCMAASWTVVALLGGIRQPAVLMAEMAVLLPVSVGFALLGWGVLRANRLCTAAVVALAAVLVGFQLAAIYGAPQRSGSSLFFLLLPALVIGVNVMALRASAADPSKASVKEL